MEESLRGRPGPFALQAAIAALHCQAARAEDTDWPQILRLYDLLERLQASPVVSLNRAVAVAMVDGPKPALAILDALAATGDLDGYHLLHAARADLLRRLGSRVDAAKSYARALALATNDSERRFLDRRLREVAAQANLTVAIQSESTPAREGPGTGRDGPGRDGLEVVTAKGG